MRLFLAIKGYRHMFDLLTAETAGKTGPEGDSGGIHPEALLRKQRCAVDRRRDGALSAVDFRAGAHGVNGREGVFSKHQ